jgi:transcriptional regulator with XRE-family HTH domain
MLSLMGKASKPLSARDIFAKNLRQKRRLQDISQEALALQAGLSRTYISEVERGVRNISIDNMGLLAETLNVPLRDLVDPELLGAQQMKRAPK